MKERWRQLWRRDDPTDLCIYHGLQGGDRFKPLGIFVCPESFAPHYMALDLCHAIYRQCLATDLVKVKRMVLEWQKKYGVQPPNGSYRILPKRYAHA